ncbi:hypothetical protein AB0H71_24190 [Nocardia sp. NPDC050697]|uniref:hypothetical protein n=1 Tax=Nocardia sp. NPDC050697 TaxID=3155158 RepID=UPI0033CB5CD1
MTGATRRFVPVRIASFTSGRSVHWIHDGDRLRIVAVCAADGTKFSYPEALNLGEAIAVGQLPLELVQGTIDHWSQARELIRGPWVFASQLGAVSFDRRDGTLLAARCPAIACTTPVEVADGRLRFHAGPGTCRSCGWGGLRVRAEVEGRQ